MDNVRVVQVQKKCILISIIKIPLINNVRMDNIMIGVHYQLSSK